MALLPQLAAMRLGPASAPHVIELYLDFVCPFSAKLYKTLYHAVFPKLGNLASQFQFIFRNQVQPWHPQSTMLHEVSLAVARLAPNDWWRLAAQLFSASEAYYDSETAFQTRNAIYKDLATLVYSQTDCQVSEADVMKLVAIQPSQDGHTSNSGNQVTDLLKKQVKLGRQNGIHVSPTVLVNGLVADQVSSSWTEDQWLDFLQKTSESN